MEFVFHLFLFLNMRLLTEYLSTKVKPTKIVATDESIGQIMLDEIRRLGVSGDFNHIDVSKCTSFTYLFDCLGDTGEKHELFQKFNGDISEWNVSNIKDLVCTFRGCHKFNCDLSNWDIKNVESLDHTFCECLDFNKPLNNWNTSKVTNMLGLFCGAEKFNQPLNHWKTDLVDEMAHMFTDAREFNQDISMWNVKNVTHTFNMFKNCPIKEEFKPKI